jgi:sigma-B regulation protein RsbU (phosphoserine phosphatase)
MSIRARLILSYLVIITGLGIGYFAVNKLIVKDTIAKKETEITNELFRVADINYARLTNEIIKNGMVLLQLNCKLTAYELSEALRSRTDWNYDTLRDDTELKEIATRSIGLYKDFHYATVYDTNSVSVWHIYKNVEGTRYLDLPNRYLELKNHIRRSIAEDKAHGFYIFHGRDPNEIVERYGAAYRIPGTPFIAGSSIEVDKFLTPFQDIAETSKVTFITVGGNTFNKIKSSLFHSNIISSILLLIFAICVVLGGTWFAYILTRPILHLTNGVHQIGSGNFTAKVHEEGTPETRALAREFNLLGEKLHDYMENLQRETSARHQYESEIKIAREIQASLVPRVFPSARQEFDLHAILNPAMEIAGDFYDFFFIDEQTLVIVIGDVSGKSVPGAMFMGVTRTILRSLCTQADDPAKVLKFTNDYLCNDNDACMFVTVFLCFYNVKTGYLTYANAGHHQAYHLKSGGKIYEFGKLGNPALGIMPEDTYNSGIEEFKPGDKLVLFTDGITEAFSPQEEMFGEERFKHMLIEYRTVQPKILCTEIVTNLNEFQAGDIFDDITMLVLQRN